MVYKKSKGALKKTLKVTKKVNTELGIPDPINYMLKAHSKAKQERAMGPTGEYALTSIGAEDVYELDERLRKFYEKHDPKKVPEADRTAKWYQGQEDQLNGVLKAEYGVDLTSMGSGMLDSPDEVLGRARSGSGFRRSGQAASSDSDNEEEAAPVVRKKPSAKHIKMLQDKPDFADKFDQVYGVGAAFKILGTGQQQQQVVPRASGRARTNSSAEKYKAAKAQQEVSLEDLASDMGDLLAPSPRSRAISSAQRVRAASGARARSGSALPGNFDIQADPFAAGMENDFSDPFKNDDAFTSAPSAGDPFAAMSTGGDPFAAMSNGDPFAAMSTGGDPFAPAGGASSAPFAASSDPFADMAGNSFPAAPAASVSGGGFSSYPATTPLSPRQGSTVENDILHKFSLGQKGMLPSAMSPRSGQQVYHQPMNMAGQPMNPTRSLAGQPMMGRPMTATPIVSQPMGQQNTAFPTW